jgi:hypothetical protein
MTGPLDVLMAEYAALKAEQLARIGTRDNLLYATLAAIGAVLAAALTSRQPACLLLVPPAGAILGWTYLVNDLKISAIREYVRADLAPRVADLSCGPAFGWEHAHLADPLYGTRRAGHLVADLTTFVAGPAAAIVVCLALVSGPAIELSAVSLTAVAETLLIAALTWQITRAYKHHAVPAGGA